MHPTLIKIQVTKDTLIPHSALRPWLEIQARPDLMPEKRCPSDAVRVAASYVLRDFQRWTGEDGTAYRAIAASPTGQKGLCLDINVQVRSPDKVEYTTRVCRLIAGAKEDSEICNEAGPGMVQFQSLHAALNVETLVVLGTDHAFESDLRRLATALLDQDASILWPGIWLQLQASKAVAQIADLSTLTIAGEIHVRHLTIDQSQANRQMLAEELAQEYCRQFERLAKRLDLPRPNVAAIEVDYMVVAKKLQQAEDLLGVPIPCLQEQMQLEEKLGAA